MHAWVVKKDFQAAYEPDRDGDGPTIHKWFPADIVGPGSADEETIRKARGPAAVAFRIYDDDQFPYYEGTFWSDEMNGNKELPETAFAPLDDFGRPDGGATEIRYLLDGKWVLL